MNVWSGEFTAEQKRIITAQALVDARSVYGKGITHSDIRLQVYRTKKGFPVVTYRMRKKVKPIERHNVPDLRKGSLAVLEAMD